MTTYTREEVIRAIRGEEEFAPKQEPGKPPKEGSSFGNISAIAGRLGVTRQTVYSYMDRWASVRQAIEDERERRKDYVEDRMMRRIMQGSDTMIIFFAKTQMKDRGFVERTELTGADGGPVPIAVINLDTDKL